MADASVDLMKLPTIQNEENMTSAVARIRRSLRGCKLRLSAWDNAFEETGYCLDFLRLLIALPFPRSMGLSSSGNSRSMGSFITQITP